MYLKVRSFWVSKPDNKILLCLELLPEEDDPDEEKVDRQEYAGVVFDLRPCRFHVFAPVDIIED